ncbi:phospholipase D-like domain-containing protein [Ralstonia pseudosolanacearum]|uniref:phospholipase D-like domain-containing protein n=2 Tax=Ralstonia pseudosolanacearum TaxID=1310165 RepID=UPI001FFB6676|nr:phospholipase D-like domain-containing protein [Ralstonia pseudosolanacearum]MDO3520644.1 phospholipase D-like domain-containing protein [Ralstonia pseudosolanacearum]MDO3564536.1 phospholipase D-like domain-containing protein [Ralstonia pseudosolanacearum]MDO3574335.1 phospholipase D-like domain-containing protein [Ralstonia pseudosolanacearum]MDO3596717.1 phospholipase D-like domain-containing protein [Ralstonia pseudosolanacearum]MDO3618110.1 phospholipase D-like domain-containing protei
MATKPIVTPLALNCTRSATITLPWFVQHTEYDSAQATFRPLVNGEEAFGAVYDAIAAAKHSIDIICWGFQPSMYFKRGSGAQGTLPIGDLLEAMGKRGVKVRLLVWSDSLHLAQFFENMTPGNNVASYRSDTRNSTQREFDQLWYWRANLNNVTKGSAAKWLMPGGAMQEIAKAIRNHALRDKALTNVEFATRDFDLGERTEIAWRTWTQGKDTGRSTFTKDANAAAMAGEPSHHQKMVLVDYEMPERAVGFVMGHNTLDAYWDRDDHGYTRMHPQMGRNDHHPRQDMSSRVTGPILQYLNRNFCQAWSDATGQQLEAGRATIASQLKLRRDFDTPVMAQILRTQSQHGKRDIEAMYLQAVNNTTNFVYIENQYFRFPPLADKIKEAAKAQFGAGRDQGKHGSLHLFVVTNSNDDGIGLGTVNTYRMLEALGRADTLPGVATLEREDARQASLGKQRAQAIDQQNQANQVIEDANAFLQTEDTASTRQWLADAQQKLKRATAKRAELEAEMKKTLPKTIQSVKIDGLEVHICTLVAPDSPPNNWDYVYVHAKLMIVDDVFMTLGSANINTRSMQVDSELNICHEHSGVTAPLRKRLWNIHTKGMGAQEDVTEAFKGWDKIIKRNAENQAKALAPYASLVGFMRDSDKRSYLD